MKKILSLYLITHSLILLPAFAQLVDPTRPSTYVGETNKNPTGPYVLQAVFNFNGKKIAIINNEFYTVGEKINDNVIAGISSYQVQLTGIDKNDEINMLVPILKPIK